MHIEISFNKNWNVKKKFEKHHDVIDSYILLTSLSCCLQPVSVLEPKDKWKQS